MCAIISHLFLIDAECVCVCFRMNTANKHAYAQVAGGAAAAAAAACNKTLLPICSHYRALFRLPVKAQPKPTQTPSVTVFYLEKGSIQKYIYVCVL